MSTTAKAPKQNPVNKYPQPPYPAQEQDMPGTTENGSQTGSWRNQLPGKW
jgi:hypothetical protein